MLRQVFITKEKDIIYQRDFGKALDESGFDQAYSQISKDAFKLTTEQVNYHDFFRYRINYLAVPEYQVIFFFVSDLSDKFDNVKKELQRCRKEFLDMFGDILDEKLDKDTFEIFNSTVDLIHKNLRPKISLVGFSGVGKTTITRLITADDIPMEHVPTITGDIGTIKIGKLHFHLWDFAGQEQFSFLWNNFIKGSDAVLLITDSTLENCEKSKYFTELINKEAPNAHAAVIGNKQDLPDALPIADIERILGLKAYSMIAIDPDNRDKMITIIADILEMSGEVSPLLKPLLKRDEKVKEAEAALEAGDFNKGVELFEELADLSLELGDDRVSQDFHEKAEKIRAILQQVGTPETPPAPVQESIEKIDEKIQPLESSEEIPAKNEKSLAEGTEKASGKPMTPPGPPPVQPPKPPVHAPEPESPAGPSSTEESDGTPEQKTEIPKPPSPPPMQPPKPPVRAPEPESPPAPSSTEESDGKPEQKTEIPKPPSPPPMQPPKPPVRAPEPESPPAPHSTEESDGIPEQKTEIPKPPSPPPMQPPKYPMKSKPSSQIEKPTIPPPPPAQKTQTPPPPPSKEIPSVSPPSIEKSDPSQEQPDQLGRLLEKLKKQKKEGKPGKSRSQSQKQTSVLGKESEMAMPLGTQSAPTNTSPSKSISPQPPSVQKQETPVSPPPASSTKKAATPDSQKMITELKIKMANVNKTLLDLEMDNITGDLSDEEFEAKSQRLESLKTKIQNQIQDLESI